MIRRFIFFGFTPLLLAAAIGLYAVGWALSRPIQRTIGAPPSSLEAEAVTFSSESGSAMRMGPLASLSAPLLLFQMPSRIGVGASELRPVDHIGQLHCAVLIVAGTLDRHTTVEDTRVFAARPLRKSAYPPSNGSVRA